MCEINCSGGCEFCDPDLNEDPSTPTLNLQTLNQSSEQFGDDRDLYWRSDTPEDFADADFKTLCEAALYTDPGMFGSVQFEAERELMRRLMKLFPPPAWCYDADGKLK